MDYKLPVDTALSIQLYERLCSQQARMNDLIALWHGYTYKTTHPGYLISRYDLERQINQLAEDIKFTNIFLGKAIEEESHAQS